MDETSRKIERWGQQVTSTSPLLGGVLRRQALQGLVRHCDSPGAIPHLVRVFGGLDEAAAGQARVALELLADPSAVDELCRLWAESRDEGLGQVVESCRYMARQPLEVRVLSGLRAGRVLELAQEEGPALLAVVRALTDTDERVREKAEAVLESAADPEAVDALCGWWAESRDERLGRLIESHRFQARGPEEVRILTGLRAGRAEELAREGGPAVPLLARALEDADEAVRTAADAVLRSLANPAAVDTLIDGVLDGSAGERVVRIIDESGHRHSARGRHLQYLVLAGRFDECLEEDLGFRELRPEFKAAPAELQARIREAVSRSGDVRMEKLLVVPSRETILGRLSDGDADLLVDLKVRHRDWESLFKCLWVLPARLIARTVAALGRGRWRPAEPHRAALLDRLDALVVEIGGEAEPGATGPLLGPVLDRWLARGAGAEVAGEPEGALRARLRNQDADPQDQLAALGALRHRGRLDDAALEAAGRSAHWMVRLAAASLGGRVTPGNDGAGLWFERLAPLLSSGAIWGFKPCEVTLDGLEALQKGLATLPERRAAGGLLLLEAVAAHYAVHDLEIDVGARVLVGEDSMEIAG